MADDRNLIRDGDSTTAGIVAIVLIAAVLIVGFLMFMMQIFPFNQVGSETDYDINTDVQEGTTPDMNINVPDADVPPRTPVQ